SWRHTIIHPAFSFQPTVSSHCRLIISYAYAWARRQAECGTLATEIVSWARRKPQAFCMRRTDMERQLAMALAGLTTGIYVLTVRAGERQHGMSSSWATQVSGTPVLIMAAVDQQHVTHQMVLASGAFALNIVGSHSKHLEDYFYSAQARRPDNLTPF